MIFSLQEGNFAHDGYFGLFEPILGSAFRRLHELLNLVGRGRERQRGSVTAKVPQRWRLDNLRGSSGERWREVAPGVLVMNLNICDSPWVAVPPLIRESLSISRRYYGNRGSSTSEYRDGTAQHERIRLTTNSTLSITEALQPDPTGQEYAQCGRVFK